MRFFQIAQFLFYFIIASVSAQISLAVDVSQELEIMGGPIPDGINFQQSATELARDVVWLDNFLLVICTIILFIVLALLGFVIFRFNASRNPTPSRVTHNTPLEVAWTLIPIAILIVIGVASLPLLFKQQRIPEADVTIKATGNQWYWSYDYMDHEFVFDSFMLGRSALERHGYTQDEYTLATDEPVVIPVNKTVVMYVTASDVIHSWTVPAFGVKQDGVPGRLAGLWFKPEKEGIYFGQCSELCGKDHSYMPITVKVVSQETYDDWVQRSITEFAQVNSVEKPILMASVP
ncbi:MAG: cytochrome c oxidase subunit II [Rhodobacteraceae bacterium]|nr:cytochrome c oxidase subunit II [Paracoccaceae bacterium]